MDKQVLDLTSQILNSFQSTPEDERLLIGISGIPASGKSALARHLVKSINSELQQETAILVGMDGWHYSRKQLDSFPDPKLAHDRRGAAFTFDSRSFSNFIESLRIPISKARQPPEVVEEEKEGIDNQISLSSTSSSSSTSTPLPSNTLFAPTFSHSLKDPVSRDLKVLPSHRIVIVEGLYCNLNEGEWVKSAKLFHLRIVTLLDKEVAKERLKIRHVRTGVAKDDEEAIWRAENNDLPNGDYLLSHILEPALKVPSLDQPEWAGAE